MNKDLKRKEEIERRLFELAMEDLTSSELEAELKEIDSQLCERCGGTGEEFNGNDPNPPVCFECGGGGYKR